VTDLAYTALERLHAPRVVGRTDYVVRRARGKVVFDLGALDETALVKRGTGFWLHEALSEAARRVYGIDSSPTLPDKGLVTGPTSQISHGDIFRLGERPEADDVEMIVAGELLEHLPNALAFLRSLTADPKLRGTELIATTPNATALHNFILGLAQRESMHRDHLQVFSYKTLTTLCQRAGLASWTIIPYHATFPEMRLQGSRPQRAAVTAFERAIGAAERLFPLLAGGYIVDAII
jgi:hypothetical protein